MLSIETYGGTILVVKNSEVTTILPYMVIQTVSSMKMEVYINGCWAVCDGLTLFPVLPHSLGMRMMTDMYTMKQFNKTSKAGSYGNVSGRVSLSRGSIQQKH